MYVNDIPRDAAMAAHRGTSFVPDERAEQERDNYAQTLRQDHENLSKLATTDEKREILAEEFARYRAGFRKHYLDHLSAQSRCMSSMIAGPSNFPTSRNQKRLDTEHRRLEDLLSFRERALKAIRRKLRPELAPVMAGDADAVERLKAKIQKAEEKQQFMKTVNAVWKKYQKNPKAIEAFTEKVQQAVRAFEAVGPDALNPRPYPGYAITNNSANIRRMKERAEHLTKVKAQDDTSTEGEGGIRLEDCPADNRVRLFFPGKPVAEIRTDLKRHAFHWTPSLGCWQAYRNPYSIDHARSVAQVKS